MPRWCLCPTIYGRTELRIHEQTFLHQGKNLVTPKLKELREFRPKFSLSLVIFTENKS